MKSEIVSILGVKPVSFTDKETGELKSYYRVHGVTKDKEEISFKSAEKPEEEGAKVELWSKGEKAPWGEDGKEIELERDAVVLKYFTTVKTLEVSKDFFGALDDLGL